MLKCVVVGPKPCVLILLMVLGQQQPCYWQRHLFLMLMKA
jgi:hypothetical protein